MVCAGAAALVPLPRPAVERLYSSGLYLTIQPLITAASNTVPIALLDVCLIAVAAAWLANGVRDARRGDGAGRAAARIAGRTIVWSAAFYLVFLAAWGLNYRRMRLADKLPYDPSRVTADAARDAAMTTVARLNDLHDEGHDQAAASGADSPLAAGFDRARRDAGIPRAILVGRPKRTMLDPYLRRAGVDGMTDPFFLETLVAGGVLPFERPFVVAHEWSHLAGIADEGEANFVGWLACLRGTIANRYSGWLFLYAELSRAVRPADRAALSARLGPGPRADLKAIADRFRRQVSPAVSAAGWRVYDRYLKANRVEAGAASYAEVVRLALGVRFGPDWTPQLRTIRN